MHYLTNFYKSRCEDLEKKISLQENIIFRTLLDMAKEKKRGEQAKEHESAEALRAHIQSAYQMIPVASYFGDHNTVTSLLRTLGHLHGANHGLGELTQQDIDLFRDVHSGAYQPPMPQPGDFGMKEPMHPQDVNMLRQTIPSQIRFR